MILKSTYLAVALLGAAMGLTLTDVPTIYLVGDSTMADKPLIGNPERGWGQVFPLFFGSGIAFENHARNGRSIKSFINEGRWNTVYERLQEGDYVLIHFGNNDSKKEDTTRYAEPHTIYKQNLLRFVRESRAKGAVPILITPVVRRRFDKHGKFFDVHGDYPDVVREVGKEVDVPVIDLHARSMTLLRSLGADRSKELFLRAPAGQFSAIPKGKSDDTHFCWRGASQVAALVVEDLKERNIPFARYLLSEGPQPFVGIGKTILLDCFFNNEWRADSTGKSVRFHYVWHDSTNSGYSILGGIISKTGAVIDTLCQQPTLQNLQHASIYLLVDPDTPKETQSPNYMNNKAAATIAAWVHAGGILVLLGNDKGNAEFERFNTLSERFGIHFNEDSRNRVAGKEYHTGTFERFPDHPLFKDVRKVFIKELSTLSIQMPAEQLLADSGHVIMAFARYGKGAVFALGDPWLYDEYMDNRRLPVAYENPKAADNLFQWLLSMAHEHHISQKGS